jgi:histidinol-phosphate aminotransferase
MVDNFFNAQLQKAESRLASTQTSARFLLDKNEQSDDVDMALKMEVMNKLMQANWNRYPNADYSDIEANIADYCGLQADQIVLSAGSANMITTLLNYFALNQKKITITQPSYSLFDYHCKTYNIPYTPWLLTPELEFDHSLLPKLDADAVLIVTSPNNPVGNSIRPETLEYLLRTNPEACIILDGVYAEFADTDFTPLIKKYDNLIVLRSFSKAFPIAGLRLGYLCAAPKTAAIIKKLILQFSIAPFSLIFAREILFSPAFMADSKKRVRDIIQARDNMYQSLQKDFSSETLHVFRSEGNFLLIRIFDKHQLGSLMSDFNRHGIKVLNTSGFPLLENTFRVSIGSSHENEVFYQCMLSNLPLRITSGALEGFRSLDDFAVLN